MTIIRRFLGLIVILTSLFGVGLSVGCTIYGRDALDTAAQQTLEAIDLARENIRTTNDALRLAQDTIGEVNDTLTTVESTAAGLAVTVNETKPLFDQINEITTERVPDTLEAVENTLPNIAEVAGAVDDTLTALSNFGFTQRFFGRTIEFTLGIEYDPNTRFDESIESMGESLEGLPEQLRELGPEIENTQANLNQVSGEVETLTSDIASINENLADLPPLLGEYIDSLDTVDRQLETVITNINNQLETAKQGVLFVSIWFGLIQLAPLYIGWQMLTAPSTESLKEDIKDDLFDEMTLVSEEDADEPAAPPAADTMIAEIEPGGNSPPFDPNETIIDEPPTKG